MWGGMDGRSTFSENFDGPGAQEDQPLSELADGRGEPGLLYVIGGGEGAPLGRHGADDGGGLLHFVDQTMDESADGFKAVVSGEEANGSAIEERGDVFEGWTFAGRSQGDHGIAHGTWIQPDGDGAVAGHDAAGLEGLDDDLDVRLLDGPGFCIVGDLTDELGGIDGEGADEGGVQLIACLGKVPWGCEGGSKGEDALCGALEDGFVRACGGEGEHGGAHLWLKGVLCCHLEPLETGVLALLRRTSGV